MPLNFNKCLIGGHLTRDPELRYTTTGTAIAKFGVATSRYWNNDAGERKEETLFADVDAFGKTAEVISQYFKKGKPIFIEGRLKLDQWEDKNTHQKQSKLRIVLESFSFVENKGAGDAPAAPRSAPQPATSAPAPAPVASDDDAPPF